MFNKHNMHVVHRDDAGGNPSGPYPSTILSGVEFGPIYQRGRLGARALEPRDRSLGDIAYSGTPVWAGWCGSKDASYCSGSDVI
jgi:hypothetical protein